MSFLIRNKKNVQGTSQCVCVCVCACVCVCVCRSGALHHSMAQAEEALLYVREHHRRGRIGTPLCERTPLHGTGRIYVRAPLHGTGRIGTPLCESTTPWHRQNRHSFM